jgi:hypothetical protein
MVLLSVEGGYVGVEWNEGPMVGEYTSGVFVDFAHGNNFVACSF